MDKSLKNRIKYFLLQNKFPGNLPPTKLDKQRKIAGLNFSHQLFDMKGKYIYKISKQEFKNYILEENI